MEKEHWAGIYNFLWALTIVTLSAEDRTYGTSWQWFGKLESLLSWLYFWQFRHSWDNKTIDALSCAYYASFTLFLFCLNVCDSLSFRSSERERYFGSFRYSRNKTWRRYLHFMALIFRHAQILIMCKVFQLADKFVSSDDI